MCQELIVGNQKNIIPFQKEVKFLRTKIKSEIKVDINYGQCYEGNKHWAKIKSTCSIVVKNICS